MHVTFRCRAAVVTFTFVAFCSFPSSPRFHRFGFDSFILDRRLISLRTFTDTVTFLPFTLDYGYVHTLRLRLHAPLPPRYYAFTASFTVGISRFGCVVYLTTFTFTPPHFTHTHIPFVRLDFTRLRLVLDHARFHTWIHALRLHSPHTSYAHTTVYTRTRYTADTALPSVLPRTFPLRLSLPDYTFPGYLPCAGLIYLYTPLRYVYRCLRLFTRSRLYARSLPDYVVDSVRLFRHLISRVCHSRLYSS